MTSPKAKINGAAVKAILRSPKAKSTVLGVAQKIAVAAGPGMRASVKVGRNRARAKVVTATRAARHAEASSRALTRAIDAGR